MTPYKTNWGVVTDKKVPRDHDGDGIADVVVYRPTEGNWYVQGQATIAFRVAANDLPLPVFGVQPPF